MVARLLFLTICALFLATPGVRAGSCRPVNGFFSSMPAPDGCTSPVGFCTAGELIGGIQGSYAFTMTAAAPGDPATPGVTAYAGRSVISPKQGGTLLAVDNGIVDLNPFGTSRMVALLTLTGGAGGAEGASGWLQLRGAMDLGTGAVMGDFTGEVCTP
ncbi:MAG TPA: hypothetical protein VLS93_01025 [Anaeromyxobacteraceae bacterium]|nr:hypothetical protein [Anaeromyxobacteraceae bacterium]